MIGTLAECGTGRSGAACGMTDEIASSTNTALLFCPTHTVDGVRRTHVARLMQARSDVVPGLRGTETNDNLGACPTTLCGQRITVAYSRTGELRPSRGDLAEVDCAACRMIARCIMDGMTPIERRELRGSEPDDTAAQLGRWGFGAQ